jgi:predicted nucleic acid-binding protein
MAYGIDTTFLVQVEISESPEHERAHAWLKRTLADQAIPFALAPQVLTEFIHVATDARRFAAPLPIELALEKAEFWWNASEVIRVLPSPKSTDLTLQWIRAHRLGRKRLLDTQLAATYYSAGVTQILTANAADFAVFEVFSPVAY